MKIDDWEKEQTKVTAFLDTIDLESEITDEEECIDDFIERLEAKYPFKTEFSHSLFDAFGAESFGHYLSTRYKDKGLYTFTRQYTFVAKSKAI